MNFINIGFGSVLAQDKILAMLSPESAPIKRLLNAHKEKGRLIDATYGRKTKTILITTTGTILLCGINPETLLFKLTSTIFLAKNNIVSILCSESAPIKRMIADARENARLIDATYGKKTTTLLITDSDYIITLSTPFTEVVEYFNKI